MSDNHDPLDRFLDRLTDDETAAPPDLDPDLVATVRRMRTISTRVRPDPSFVDHLEEQLMTAVSLMPPQAPMSPLPMPDALLPPSHRHLPRPQGGRWALLLVAAAMLILAVGFAANPTGPIRTWLDGRNEPHGFAVQAPGTPLPDTDVTLLTVHFAADEMPRGGGPGPAGGLVKIEVPPGNQATWDGVCCTGQLVNYVVEGDLTVRADAPIRVVRADGDEEEIAAGVEAVVGPGEAMVSRVEVPTAYRNDGGGAVALINWVLIETGDFGGYVPAGWVGSVFADVQGDLVVPSGPATLVLRRVDLEPDGVVAGRTDGGIQLLITVPFGDSGVMPASARRDPETGEIQSKSNVTVSVYILTLTPDVDAGAATPVLGTPGP